MNRTELIYMSARNENSGVQETSDMNPTVKRHFHQSLATIIANNAIAMLIVIKHIAKYIFPFLMYEIVRLVSPTTTLPQSIVNGNRLG